MTELKVRDLVVAKNSGDCNLVLAVLKDHGDYVDTTAYIDAGRTRCTLPTAQISKRPADSCTTGGEKMPSSTEEGKKAVEELHRIALDSPVRVLVAGHPLSVSLDISEHLKLARLEVYRSMYVPQELLQQQSRVFRVEKVRKRGPRVLYFPLDDFIYITADSLVRMKVDVIYKSARWSWGDYALLAAFVAVPWMLVPWFGG